MQAADVRGTGPVTFLLATTILPDTLTDKGYERHASYHLPIPLKEVFLLRLTQGSSLLNSAPRTVICWRLAHKRSCNVKDSSSVSLQKSLRGCGRKREFWWKVSIKNPAGGKT